MSRSSRAVLDKHLQAIQDDVLRMAHLLDAAISRSLEALAAQDARLAQEIVAGDAQINALRFGIEEACLALIATQQPAAGDLRAVIAAMNIVGDMERMADHAAGVARLVQTMGGEPLLKPLIDIPRMVEVCRSMLRESLQAFVERNPDKARQVAIQDNTIDALYKQIFRELLSFMVEDPATTSRALVLLFAAHNYERIGDRATNIAERVIFLASGEMRELNPEPPGTSHL
ncbi:MAG: phosphate transport system regulatory protein PhoU [Chloroflexi bacterium RBG_13_68_17]|nr:MAG: phosphate transport system regulatory protein PhoU [Chloroflexi bacterium RBG_13_68_17]